MSDFLDRAIQVRTPWKNRLVTAISLEKETGIDRAVVTRDCHCDLGEWIHGDGKQYAGRAEFIQMKEAHQRFHASIGKVLDRILAKDMDGARAELDHGEFSRCSHEVVRHIHGLKTSSIVKPT